MKMSKGSGDYFYISGKIAHMTRMGLINGKSTGIGKNGGACPDWLSNQQQDAMKARALGASRAIGSYYRDVVESTEWRERAASIVEAIIVENMNDE